MENQLDAQKLLSMTNQLVDALTSDEFISRMRQIRNAPEEKRLELAASCLSASGLRQVEPSIPADIRISSRYFEVSQPPSSIASLIKEIEVAAPGFIDELKKTRPEIHKNLLSAAEESSPSKSKVAGGGATVMGVCAGGGANGTCACAGNPLV